MLRERAALPIRSLLVRFVAPIVGGAAIAALTAAMIWMTDKYLR